MGKEYGQDNDRWIHRWCIHRDGAKRRNEARMNAKVVLLFHCFFFLHDISIPLLGNF